MLRIAKGAKLTWYDIENPTQEDVESLRRELHVHPLVLEDILPQVRHPKLDLLGNHLFLVLTIPSLQKSPKNHHYIVRLEELDIIFGQSWVVSSHYQSLDVVNELFSQAENEKTGRIEYLDNENPATLLYAILSRILRQAITSLGSIEEHIEEVEQSVLAGMQREMVQELSYLRHAIIDFRRALSPSRPVFRALDDAGPALLGPDTLPYFRNLTGRIEQIATLLATLKETIEALEETNQSLLTTHTNDIIRLLTIFTASLLPLTLIASIFGMNIDFPFMTNTVAFWIVMGSMAGIVFSLLLFFRTRRWL